MHQDLVWDVAMTAKALRMAFDRRAQALGVTRAQWKLLLWLSKMPEAKQVELADKLEIEPITLSRQVDRLAEAGLVERVRDPADRRAWRLRLARKAEPLLAQLREVGDDVSGGGFAGFDEAEMAILQKALQRVRDNLAGEACDRGVK